MSNKNENPEENRGCKTIFAGPDLSGFKKGSDEEAEAVFSNCTIKIAMKDKVELEFEKPISEVFLNKQQLDNRTPDNCPFTSFNFKLLNCIEAILGDDVCSKKEIKIIISPHENLLVFAESLSEEKTKIISTFLVHDSQHYNICVSSVLPFLSEE